MSPQGAVAVAGFTMMVSGLALLVRGQRASLGTSLASGPPGAPDDAARLSRVRQGSARLQLAAVALLVAGGATLLVLLVGLFIWWFVVGTHLI